MDKDPIYLCTMLMFGIFAMGGACIFLPFKRQSKQKPEAGERKEAK